MKRVLSFAAVGVVTNLRLTVSICLMLAGFKAMSEEIDQRRIIQLNEAQQGHVLGEMRTMLSGTQVILASLAANDMAEVARQARLLGMGMGHKAENTVHDALPPAFMQLGMSVHKAFDQLANDAESGAGADHALAQLSAAMTICVSCHEIYQIQRAASR